MKYLLFPVFVFLISAHSFAAGIYKCSVEGGTVYQELPCSEDGEELTIRTGSPSTAPATDGISGLRDTERALLEQLQTESEQEKSPPPPPSPPSANNTTKSCQGIQVSDFKPYTDRFVDDYGYTRINHCARVKLRLDIYAGRLRDSVAEDIGSRFYARFINGEVALVYSISLEGPDRVSLVNKHFSASICFGNSRYDIEQVGCD